MREVRIKIRLPEVVYQTGLWILLFYRKMRYGEAFRIIPLTKGYVAIVSPEDYDRLAVYNWYAVKCRHTVYAERGRHIRMHREVMRIKDDRVVDHHNHNGLDNRNTNLRIASFNENVWNRRKTFSKCTSKFKGVCWSGKNRKWHAQIRKDGKPETIGYFDDETEAAIAYDGKAKELYGEFAALNFPDKKTDPLGDWSFKICYLKFNGQDGK